MGRIFSFTVVATAAALLVVGCGSDSSDPGGSSGAPTDAQCHGDYAVLTQAQFDAAVADEGACIEASDRGVVCGNDSTAKAAECGSSCFARGGDEEKQNTCVAECMDGATTPALSTGCIDCYVADIACAREHCLLKCGSAPKSQGCADCRAENGCASAFFMCSGLPGGE